MAGKLKNDRQAKDLPPSWAVRFFRWYCNDHLAEAVLGDLLEIHERRCLQLGRRTANILFVWNVFQFLQPFALKRKKRYTTPDAMAMTHNSMKIAWRTMSKQKLFIAINVMGMSIAVACCIITWCNYDFNAQFDRYNKNASSIYRVNSIRQFQNQLTEFGYVPLPVVESVRANAGDVSLMTRYIPVTADIRIGDQVFSTGFSYVDPEFFRIFTLEFLESDHGVFDKTKLFISETAAKRLFGNKPALGKAVTQVLSDNKLREFTVGGVFKTPPTNSSFNDDIFVHYENQFEDHPEMRRGTNWGDHATLFVYLIDPSRVSMVEKQLTPLVKANNQAHEDFIVKNFHLDSFDGMALRDRDPNRQGVWTRGAISFASVFGSAVMSVMVILIACFNLTNTAISISSRRLKEIGIRKVMGGLRSQLVVQFMGETMLICFVSLALGMILAETFLLPEFNKLWPYMQLEIHYRDNPAFLIYMIGVLLFTAILAGSYPAFYITRFQPNEILKGKLSLGGAGIFSHTLLTLQYAISLIAIVNSFAFVNNAWYQRHYDLGFDHSGIVYTRVQNGKDFETFKNALAGDPDILAIGGSRDHLFSRYYQQSIKNEGREFETDAMDVGADYVTAMGFHFTEGRNFNKDSEVDMARAVVITQKLAAKFNWDHAVGKEIVIQDSIKLQVIGVIHDPLTHGLWHELQPMMLRLTPQKNYAHLIVSADPQNIIRVNSMMEKKWKELFPNQVYGGHYLEDHMVEAIEVNDNLVKSFGFLGVVALILSATGLFTLVSLNVMKRVKEIAIRKVYGASVANIARVVNVKFVILLLLASAIGAFGGISFSTLLMQSIWHYYQPIGAGMLTFSVMLLFVISILTIGYKVYTTSNMNPIATLKEE